MPSQSYYERIETAAIGVVRASMQSGDQNYIALLREKHAEPLRNAINKLLDAIREEDTEDVVDA